MCEWLDRYDDYGVYKRSLRALILRLQMGMSKMVKVRDSWWPSD